MRRVVVAAVVGGMIGVAGCAHRVAPADVPAVLTNPTVESRAELLRVVREAMNGAPVTLADDALTGTDTLLIERAPRRDESGIRLEGRESARPDHVRLVKNGAACVLVHVESGRRWTLMSAACVPR
jgi:hypothetical protein